MKIYALIIIITFLNLDILMSQSDTQESPYFLVSSESELAGFPLLSTTADVQIVGPIANVSVLQTYKNEGTQAMEAVYVFPASTRSAVYHMEMRIGERILKAEIQEKNQAKETYETAKSQGKQTSLLEQHKPNVFQMNVANIPPGEIVVINLKYTEFLLPENQEYSFIYPTVVGPRFINEDKQENEYAQNPYLKSDKKAPYKFDIDISINTSIPIDKITCQSHRTDINYHPDHSANIALDQTETDGGNRDFILKYKLAGNRIQTGIQTFSNGAEQFFLCQMEAPSLDTKPTITPREYIFIIDVSGSMTGFPLDISKELMKNLLSKMNPHDKFNCMFFASSAFMLNPKSLNATPSNIQMAFEHLSSQRGGGSTEMLPAIKKAMSTPKDDGYSRSFVIITDGYVTVEEEAMEYISNSLDQANFFAFGIGSGVNRYLIEGLAHVGRGEAFVVEEQKYALRQANKLQSYIESPIMTDIKITGTGVELYDIIPKHVPDLMAARPIYFFGKLKDHNGGQLNIQGRQGDALFNTSLDIPATSADNSALKYLWAREKIRFLDDFNSTNVNEARIKEITELGLKYNLMTKYTSFVAVDHEPVVRKNEATQRVKQTLPMPQGVTMGHHTNYAIGFEMELPQIHDENNKIRTQAFLVEVHCEDLLMEELIDNVLELLMQDLSLEELRLFNGQEWSIRMASNGKIDHINGYTLSSNHFYSQLNDALSLLNIQNDKAYNITVKFNLGSKK